MKYYKSQHSFRGDSKSSTLLYRITYNHTIDLLRRRKPRSCELNEEIVSEPTQETNQEINKEQIIVQLDRAISTLDIEDQAILTLFYTEEKTIEEISKIATLSTANIKVRLHRIRKKLHTIISEQDHE